MCVDDVDAFGRVVGAAWGAGVFPGGGMRLVRSTKAQTCCRPFSIVQSYWNAHPNVSLLPRPRAAQPIAGTPGRVQNNGLDRKRGWQHGQAPRSASCPASQTLARFGAACRRRNIYAAATRLPVSPVLHECDFPAHSRGRLYVLGVVIITAPASTLRELSGYALLATAGLRQVDVG